MEQHDGIALTLVHEGHLPAQEAYPALRVRKCRRDARFSEGVHSAHLTIPCTGGTFFRSPDTACPHHPQIASATTSGASAIGKW